MEGALQKNGWSSCSSDVATFSFAAEESDQKRTIAACPVDAKGPGWICRIEGHQLVGYICKSLPMITDMYKGSTVMCFSLL